MKHRLTRLATILAVLTFMACDDHLVVPPPPPTAPSVTRRPTSRPVSTGHWTTASPFSWGDVTLWYSGQEIDFAIDDGIDEVLSPSTFLHISSEPLDRSIVVDKSTITIPIKAGLEYCRVASNPSSGCRPSLVGEIFEHYQCLSDSATMVLRKK